MKITMIGTGYVGSVTGACLADLGHEVVCLDIDKEKIEKFSKGEMPLYEPGLSDLVKRNVRECRLSFTTDKKAAISGADVVFIAVGTPSTKDGSVDLKYVDSAAEDIGKFMNNYLVIVDKSTVPVGTADRVKDIILKSQKTKIPFDLVSNPEFLREGQAIKDFMAPDRIVIGVDDGAKARQIMHDIYKGIERTGKPVLFTDVKSAEMIKYASNAMLATRISFMNEIARICERAGADVKIVAQGIGLDSRIGSRFLQAGVGYGGSCFPKDVKGLIHTGEEYGVNFKLLKAVEEVNEEQKRYIIPKIVKELGDLKGKRIAIWGLAFKAKTDDVREASSLVIISELQKLGAVIKAFDPEAMHVTKNILKNVEYAKNAYEAAEGCDALVVVTEWDEFRGIDLARVKKLLKKPVIFDGRNIYDPKEMRDMGFTYQSIGRQ